MENQIHALRKQLGISQEALAWRCGVSRQTINAIENNKYDPTLVLAFHLAQVLGTTVDAPCFSRHSKLAGAQDAGVKGEKKSGAESYNDGIF